MTLPDVCSLLCSVECRRRISTEHNTASPTQRDRDEDEKEKELWRDYMCLHILGGGGRERVHIHGREGGGEVRERASEREESESERRLRRAQENEYVCGV